MSDDRFARLFAHDDLDVHLRASSEPVLVACSGGGDSIALLHLTVFEVGAERVRAATVNHHLREEAAQEIALVARHCAALGVGHEVLDWHWDGQGNLQAAARVARRTLLMEEADRVGAKVIILGHTRDDQAETVLLRLARGSGVDGLSGMRARTGRFYRPLLNTRRAELRDWLTAKGLDWAEDPSNEDPRFDRVRARQMADTLADLGLTQDRLLQTADLMRQESRALEFALRKLVGPYLRESGGALSLPFALFRQLPGSFKSRLCANIVRWFTDGAYKPRREALATWQSRFFAGAEWAPLGGVMACRLGEREVVFEREVKAAFGRVRVAEGGETHWDHRWIVDGPFGENLTVGALGDDLGEVPNWRESGASRRALQTTPAVWRGEELIAAPVAGLSNGWTATLRPTFAEFLDTH